MTTLFPEMVWLKLVSFKPGHNLEPLLHRRRRATVDYGKQYDEYWKACAEANLNSKAYNFPGYPRYLPQISYARDQFLSQVLLGCAHLHARKPENSQVKYKMCLACSEGYFLTAAETRTEREAALQLRRNRELKEFDPAI